ncbi:MAG: ABC transporter ATP-binding protein, partial [Alphaproteobacteria bacterium]|nr:ABC transporter ATP-binding protein [Alphaproteobacteria bacterium]
SSGCGKSTLLRLIGGFETPDQGRVAIDGVDMSGVPPHRRPVNTVFQSYALFPHLTIAGNIGFGLARAGRPRDEIKRRIAELTALVQLQGLEERKPHQLSGGQRQRVALARALALKPKALLLDEPLAALDRQLRDATRAELVALQKRTGTTFILVTHDQEEALATADRIVLMQAGRLVQSGAPMEVYGRPATRWVASFLGEVNLIPGQGIGADRMTTPLGDFDVPGAEAGREAVLVLRPERLVLDPVEPLVNRITGRIETVAFLGDRILISARASSGEILKVMAAAKEPPSPGRDVTLAWPADAATLVPP